MCREVIQDPMGVFRAVTGAFRRNFIWMGAEIE